MKLWELASGRETILQTSSGNEWHDLGAAAFSPDSACLAIASWQGQPEIKLIGTKYWIPKQTFDMTLDEDAKEPASVWLQFISGVRFSPDGRWLAAARSIPRSVEHEVFLWDLQPDADR
jgi:WD40 repeat protein